MLRSITLYVFLIATVIIGLGAFGHGYSGRGVHGAIDQFPIDPVIHQTIYVVWYMASGTMLTFAAILFWIWFRLRARDASSLFVAYAIGVLHIISGVCALIYRRGDPFWGLFIILGVLLVGSSFVLGADARHKLLSSPSGEKS
jgi:hypothetical protein